jgi:hypothetical protein
MYDAYDILENTCERAMRELHDLNKKLSKDEGMISKEDIDLMESLTHTVASTKKGMAMIDKYYDDGQSNWNRRPMNNRRGGSRSSRMDDMYDSKYYE